MTKSDSRGPVGRMYRATVRNRASNMEYAKLIDKGEAFRFCDQERLNSLKREVMAKRS